MALNSASAARPFRAGHAHRTVETMVDVIADQRLLGVRDRVLDRLQLLGEIEAGAPLREHADDRLQMPVGALEALDDFRMTVVQHVAPDPS
jgi:hypothetical protein